MAKIENLTDEQLENLMEDYNKKIQTLELQKKEVLFEKKDREKKAKIKKSEFFEELFFKLINPDEKILNRIEEEIKKMTKYTEKEKQLYIEEIKKKSRKKERNHQEENID